MRGEASGLQAEDAHARLKPLASGSQTVNKCLGVLASMPGYAVKHKLVARKIAERTEKLCTKAGSRESSARAC